MIGEERRNSKPKEASPLVRTSALRKSNPRLLSKSDPVAAGSVRLDETVALQRVAGTPLRLMGARGLTMVLPGVLNQVEFTVG